MQNSLVKMRYKIIFVYILTILQCSSVFSFKLRKCCPIGQNINMNITGCQANKNKEWTIERGLLQKLPKNFSRSIPVNSTEDEVFNIPCKTPKVMTLMWMDQDSDFQIDRDSGALTPALPVAGVKVYNVSEFCLDEVQSDEGETGTVALTCPCLKGMCVNVCCEKGMLVDTSSNSSARCVAAQPPWSMWQIEKGSSHLDYFTAYGAPPPCPSGASTSVLNTNMEGKPKLNFQVLPNGTMLVQSTPPQWLEPAHYCVGVIEYRNITEVNVIKCSADLSEERLHAEIYSALFMVGALFLLATLVVYLLLPELRRAVRGLSLMAHCACMLVAHIALTIIQQQGSYIADVPCHILAYVIQYSLLAGFFWMNVMCFDIASTFRSLQTMAHGDSGELRKFLWYSLYAMGTPLLIFLVTYLADATNVLPESIRPKIGVNFCWFDKNSTAILVFFYGPIGLVLLFNFGLFVFTAYKIISYTRNPILNQQDSQRHDSQKDRKRFMLFLKLFGLMGIPWVMEIISWAVGGEDYYWYFTDAINLLRSVFIFILFCCKRKVWALLTKRHPKITNQISKRLTKKTDQTSVTQEDCSTSTSRTNIEMPDVDVKTKNKLNLEQNKV